MNEIAFREFFTEIGLTPPPFEYDFRQHNLQIGTYVEHRVTFTFEQLVYCSSWCESKLEAVQEVIESFFSNFITEINNEKVREENSAVDHLKLYINTSQSISSVLWSVQHID